MTLLGVLVAAIWIGLTLTGFWTCRERDTNAPLARPDVWPEVVAVVPARDEADVIARSIGSLPRRIIRGLSASCWWTTIPRRHGRYRPRSGFGPADGDQWAPLAAGWTGKLWAVHQGLLRRAPRSSSG
jgi:hypothetical protein